MNLFKSLISSFGSLHLCRKPWTTSDSNVLTISRCKDDDSDIFNVDWQVRSIYGIFETRRKSFPFWVDAATSDSLAEEGFYYDGSLDAVECFCCRASVSSWKYIVQSSRTWLMYLHYATCSFAMKTKQMRGAINFTSRSWKTVWNSSRCDICNEMTIMVPFLCGHQYACLSCVLLTDVCLICHRNAVLL